MEKTKIAYKQQGLDRALELLEMLAKNGAGMNISEISKALGITRVTASNLVQSLLHRYYIEKDPVTGKLSLGYKLFELAQFYRYRYPFLYVAEEHVRSMADKLHVRINICVLKPPGVAVLILSKDVSQLPKMILGYVFPGHASASGKLLMAFGPDDKVEEWLNCMEYTRHTQYTIGDKEKLEKELDEIRSQGVAYEYEEMMLQRCCLAAPIRDISGKVIASISFSAEKEIIENSLPVLTENLKLLAKTISSNLGYNALMLS